MKVNNQLFSFASFKLISIIIFILSIYSKNTLAQTTIYKKDGKQIDVSQIDTINKVVSYKTANLLDSSIYYISRSIIDSIRFENGTRIFNPPTILQPNSNEKPNKIKRNFVGFDIWPYFGGRINAFYEILIWKDELSFKNKILYKNHSYYYDDDDESRKTFSLTSGFNYYFLHSEYFRFGTGIALELGKMDVEDYDFYNQNNDYTGEYRPPPIIREPFRYFYASFSFSYILKKKFYTTLELSLPVSLKQIKYHQATPSIFKTEIAFNF